MSPPPHAKLSVPLPLKRRTRFEILSHGLLTRTVSTPLDQRILLGTTRVSRSAIMSANMEWHPLHDPQIRIDDGLEHSVDSPHPLYRERSDPTAVSPVKTLFEMCRDAKRPLYVAAPMVRYSKLPFRALVRDYACDLVYTPMILAKEFSRHPNARNSDFTSNARDRPLVVQFAANDPVILGRAVEMVLPYTDAIGLNCGCPQSWACQEGIGASLMRKPELVAEMVRSTKSRCGRDLIIETKMRTHADLRESVSWAQQMEKAGIDFLVVHGRTKNTRSSEPVDLDAIKLIKQNVTVPVVANGDAFNLEEVNKIYSTTGVDGVMSARGLMSNPALFAGYKKCPWAAIERFITYAQAYELHHALVQHHVIEMMNSGGYWKKKDRIVFTSRKSTESMIEFLSERYEFRRHGEEGYALVDECIRKDDVAGITQRLEAIL